MAATAQRKVLEDWLARSPQALTEMKSGVRTQGDWGECWSMTTSQVKTLVPDTYKLVMSGSKRAVEIERFIKAGQDTIFTDRITETGVPIGGTPEDQSDLDSFDLVHGMNYVSTTDDPENDHKWASLGEPPYRFTVESRALDMKDTFLVDVAITAGKGINMKLESTELPPAKVVQVEAVKVEDGGLRVAALSLSGEALDRLELSAADAEKMTGAELRARLAGLLGISVDRHHVILADGRRLRDMAGSPVLSIFQR